MRPRRLAFWPQFQRPWPPSLLWLRSGGLPGAWRGSRPATPSSARGKAPQRIRRKGLLASARQDYGAWLPTRRSVTPPCRQSCRAMQRACPQDKIVPQPLSRCGEGPGRHKGQVIKTEPDGIPPAADAPGYGKEDKRKEKKRRIGKNEYETE